MLREFCLRSRDLASETHLNILEPTQHEGFDVLETRVNSTAIGREKFVADFFRTPLPFFELRKKGWSGLSEQAAKKKFAYGLEKTRQRIVGLLKTGRPKATA